MAQSVERVLGKDEVTSSNLVISSKKRNNFDCFFFYFSEKTGKRASLQFKQGIMRPCGSNPVKLRFRSVAFAVSPLGCSNQKSDSTFSCFAFFVTFVTFVLTKSAKSRLKTR